MLKVVGVIVAIGIAVLAVWWLVDLAWYLWGGMGALIFGFLLVFFETGIAKMRVFRVPEFLGAALMLGLLATLLLFVSRSL